MLITGKKKINGRGKWRESRACMLENYCAYPSVLDLFLTMSVVCLPASIEGGLNPENTEDSREQQRHLRFSPVVKTVPKDLADE